MTELRISIGRVTLDGFEPEAVEPREVRRALEAELRRLLAGAPLPAGLTAARTSPRLSSRPLQLATWRDSGDLGAQVARALYRGLGGGHGVGRSGRG
jgi:hypothetical protein